MTEENFKEFYEEQKKAGANFSLLAQLRFSFALSVPEEAYELLVQTEDFEVREWIRFSLLEGVPLEQVREYPQMDKEGIKESRRQYFLEKEESPGEKEAQAAADEKFEKLKELVERTRPMEEFLEVLLKQKDRLIEDFRQQNTRLQEQNSQMTGRLEEYRGRSEALERELLLQKAGKALPPAEPLPLWAFRKRRHRKSREEEVADYLKDPAWTPEQMEFLIDCVEEGMGLEELRQISDPNLPVKRMELLKRAIYQRKE